MSGALEARPLGKVATGNDLMLGDVVYFTEAGGWARAHGSAALAVGPEAEAALLARAAAAGAGVVGVVLASAERGADGRPAPWHLRERLRARGPSNRQHGKQETDDVSL